MSWFITYRSPNAGVVQALTLESKLVVHCVNRQSRYVAFPPDGLQLYRRFSREVQQAMVKRLQQSHGFVGTSNFRLARRACDDVNSRARTNGSSASTNQSGHGTTSASVPRLAARAANIRTSRHRIDGCVTMDAFLRDFGVNSPGIGGCTPRLRRNPVAWGGDVPIMKSAGD